MYKLMTIIEVKTLILRHLLNKDYFALDDNFQIETPKEFKDLKTELIVATLKDLEEAKVLKRIEVKMNEKSSATKSVWILETPLEFHGQDVHVSFPLANLISQQVNSYIAANNLSRNRATPLNINEGDIYILSLIINDLLDNQGKK